MDLSKMSRGGGDFTPAPAGVHNAVCVQVVDLGTQLTNFPDEKTGQMKSARQIRLAWEIDETMEATGQRFIVSKTYTASMNEKANLRKDLEAWRGVAFKESDFAPGGFSLRKLLGQGCQISMVEYERKDGKPSTKIGTLMKQAKGMAKLAPEAAPVLFDLDAYDQATYNGLSEYLKEQIAKSPEFQAIHARKPNGAPARQPGGMSAAAIDRLESNSFSEELDDEIPF